MEQPGKNTKAKAGTVKKKRQLIGQERRTESKLGHKQALASRSDSVVVLTQAEGTQYMAHLLARSDQLCSQLEKKIVSVLPVSQIEEARCLLKKREEITAQLYHHNILLETMLGAEHREIVKERARG